LPYLSSLEPILRFHTVVANYLRDRAKGVWPKEIIYALPVEEPCALVFTTSHTTRPRVVRIGAVSAYRRRTALSRPFLTHAAASVFFGLPRPVECPHCRGTGRLDVRVDGGALGDPLVDEEERGGPQGDSSPEISSRATGSNSGTEAD
jgi:hypothetical protein